MIRTPTRQIEPTTVDRPAHEAAHEAARANDQRDTDETGRHLLPVIVALAAILGVAGWIAWERWTRPLAPPPMASPRTPVSPELYPLAPPGSAQAAVAGATGTETLSGEPAGLASLPDSTRTAAMERRHGRWREHTIVRETGPAAANRALVHYRGALEDAGYRRLATDDRPAGGAAQQTWRREADDVMILRVNETPTATRVVLTRRFPAAEADFPGDRP